MTAGTHLRWGGALVLIATGAAGAIGASCASAPSGEVRAVADLPSAHRELWEAWLEDDPTWPDHRARALADPELSAFLIDNLILQMIAAYARGDFTTLPDPRQGGFERCQTELIVIGGPAAPALAELLGVGNGTAASIAHDALVGIGRPSLIPVLELLERDEEDARRRAALLLAELPHGLEAEPAVRDALVRRLETDRDWLVRRVAAEALGRRGARDRSTLPWREALSRGLSDEDPAVAREAALGLGRLADPAAIPALVNYLERSMRIGSLPGERSAQTVLMGLTRTNEHRSPRGWRDWWREYRPAPTHSGR